MTTSSPALAASRGHAAATTARTCPPPPVSELRAGSDIDDDGVSDAVIGVPGGGPASAPTSGGIDVELSSGIHQHVTENDLDPSITPAAGDDFGAAISTGGLVYNGACNGITIGAPGRDDGRGAVVSAAGSGIGLIPDGLLTLPGLDPGDRFGSALTEAPDAATGQNALYVGAPGTTVDGQVGAGAVDEFLTTYSNHTTTFTLVAVITQDTPGIAGVPEAGDGFGSTLSGFGTGVGIGIPGEDIGTVKDAGSVTFLSTSAKLTTATFDQNTRGVPGTAEAGDHFGAVVFGDWVGVPDEDIGTLKDAGLVQPFIENKAGTGWVPKAAITQDSKGIPGNVEAGDRFGAAITSGYAFSCYSSGDVAIGSPGEDVGTVKDAGSVTVYGGACAARGLTEGAGGLDGRLQAGARVGSSLSVRSGSLLPDSDPDEDLYDVLLVGAPGEDVGSTVNAGTTIEATLHGLNEGGPPYVQRLTQSPGAVASASFGASIAW